MKILAVATTQQKLDQIMEEIKETHTPFHIKHGKNSAVLISKEYWDSLQETIYLVSIPTIRDSLIEGRSIPSEECDETLNW